MEDSVPDPADAGEPPLADSCPCPHCGEPVETAHGPGPIVECPQCGTQFFPPVPGEFDAAEEQESTHEPAELTAEQELSALRIKQASTLRRTAYRTRTYWIVATGGCLLFSLQLILFAMDDIKIHHLRLVDIGFFFFALGGIIGAAKLGLQVVDVQRKIDAELRARALEELDAAKHEPDFSTLSDGSQHAQNLASMVDPGEKQD